jgi:hypothetical protein
MDMENQNAEVQPVEGAGTAPARVSPSGWTFVFISVGIGLIASCLLIPQADENRALRYQCEKLKLDLEHIQQQSRVNDEFVQRINQDPALAERLAQRQMKYIRQGAAVLELGGDEGQEDLRSPFMLATVPPPATLGALRPVGGRFAELCRHTRSRLYMMGAGLMLLATGLVLGDSPRTDD